MNMRRMPWLLTLATLLTLLPALSTRAHAQTRLQVEARYAQSLRGKIDNLPVVVLRGTLAERGQAMGALCGRDLLQTMAAILPVFQQRPGQGWPQLVALTQATFNTPEDLEQQMTALVDGLRKSLPETQRIIEPLGRELTVADLKTILAFPDLLGTGRIGFGGCSSFSAWGPMTPDGQVITGRNMDYPTFPALLPFMVVAQAPAEKDRLATIEICIPWFGASTAMNEQGVLTLMHDENGLPPRAAAQRLPRSVVLRQAIERANAATALNDVAEILRNKPMMMGANIHLSMPAGNDRQLPAVFEWDGNATGGGITLRQTAPNLLPDALFCTNHYLKRRAVPLGGDSVKRLNAMASLARQTRDAKQTIDVPTAQKIIAAAAVRGSLSTQLSIIALPAKRQLIVAVSPKVGSPATDGPWVRVDWDEVFKAQ